MPVTEYGYKYAHTASRPVVLLVWLPFAAGKVEE